MIVYISTYLNHHNRPLCDALYDLTKGAFTYVAMSKVSAWRRDMGFGGMSAPYLMDYTKGKNLDLIQATIDQADVVLVGASEPNFLIKNRLKQRRLTFRCSERLFKTRSRYLKAPVHWLRCLKTRRCYMLCSSAATARDYNLLGFYRNRCYKWGYFTEFVPTDPAALWERKMQYGSKTPAVSVLWVGRLVKWKHPEAAIFALKAIKEAGIPFDCNLIGDGPIAPDLRKLIRDLQMNDCVHMLGSKSPSEVRQFMEQSEIFLFTSGREEGWGAVLNESMSCACAVVANSEIGSVPFLIEDRQNGLIYSKGSVASLIDCLLRLFESASYRRQLGVAAYNTISENWTPRRAAENLLTLIDAVQDKKGSPIETGPCSISD